MTTNGMGELSERELEILRLVATGASNKEIAQTLFISSNTVRVHLRNIFSKIEVASRTEAAMYAVRIGLVQTSTMKVAYEDGTPALDKPIQALTPTIQPISAVGAWLQRWGLVLMLVMVLVAVGIGIMIAQLPFFQGVHNETPVIEIQPTPTAIQRWKEHAALPTARNALALAAFENQIYAIAGETTQGVTGVVERFDPVTEQWTTLKTKPSPVADVGAVVLGGKIYVPGGRMESGEISNALEVYDPVKNEWETRFSLPTALSGYALVAYEGLIYLFGGWTGSSYVNTVYSYDPGVDEWQVRTPMPTSRGFCGAAISSDQIYVLGGSNGSEALTTSEIYLPSRDNGSDNPWQAGPSLPEGRYAMGIASASDLIYIIGGRSTDANELSVLEFSPTTTGWQEQSASIPATWSSLGTVALGQYLYVMGGLVENNPTSLNLSYQAIYTVVIPFVR